MDDPNVGKDGHFYPYIEGLNDDNDDEESEYDEEDDRMDVYQDNEMDLLAYFDYSDPGPLVLSPPRLQTDHTALHAFIESVTDGNTAYNRETLANIVNDLVEGANTDFIENLFVQFEPGDLDCSRCQVLRDIFHSNGNQNVKIFVHGQPNNFTHTIFEVENVEGIEPKNDRYYLDLRTVDHSWVDGFMQFYLSFLPVDGSTTMRDNKTSLYDTLCGRASDRPENAVPENTVPALDMTTWSSSSQPPSTNESVLGITESSSIQAAEENPARRRRAITDPTRVKTGLAAQRERTQTMSLEELSHYFHLSIARAAKELNLCSTAVKHICRRHGIARWPGRKVISINKQLSKLERLLPTKEGEELESIREQIQSLGEQKRIIYETGLA